MAAAGWLHVVDFKQRLSNSRKRIRSIFAGPWKLETRNSKLYSLPRGAVAQLAERRVRNAEARSSTLLCSTNQIK